MSTDPTIVRKSGTPITDVSSPAYTSSYSRHSGGVDRVDWVVELASAISGTNPTLTFEVEESDDNSNFIKTGVKSIQFDSYTTVPAGGVARDTIQLVTTRAWSRLSWTVGGTSTPTFPVNIRAVPRRT